MDMLSLTQDETFRAALILGLCALALVTYVYYRVYGDDDE